MAVKKLRLGIIYGGRSGEHEVSVVSAASIFRNLDRKRFDAVPIRVELDGRWTVGEPPPMAATTAESGADLAERLRGAASHGSDALFAPRPGTDTIVALERGHTPDKVALARTLHLDVVFPVLHGPSGEDGTVQGLFELANVPYVGSGVLSSAITMDKAIMKTVLAAAGLPIVAHRVVFDHEWRVSPDACLTEMSSTLDLPVFVKPANMGSSVGISKVNNESDLADAIEVALEYDRKVIVEAGVTDARELECAVLGNDEPVASVVGEAISSREFYDYEAKYLDETLEIQIPASIGETLSDTIRRMALAAFRALDCAGMARADFLVPRDTDTLFINELNTIPGFTSVSMYPMLWDASGVSQTDLITRLVTLAVERHSQKQRLRTTRK